MNVVKVTTSGQISIPSNIRKKFKTDYFLCEERDGGIFFKSIHTSDPFEKKHTLKDLSKGIFKSKNPKETSLAYKIDEIIYAK